MHRLSSVYFVYQPLHISDVSTAHHQQVYLIYTTNGTYYFFQLTLPSWLVSTDFGTWSLLLFLLLWMPLVTGLFFLVPLLNQRWSPPFRLQASHCSTFRIMCDVPSIAVFCSESIECFPGTTSKFFLKLLVTIPVAPIITGIIVHFRFHIRCISIHKLLYFIYCISAVVTQHIKSAVILQLVTFGNMFRPLPGHHQAKKNINIKVHSTSFSNGIPLFTLKTVCLDDSKMLVKIVAEYRILTFLYYT